MRYRQGDEIKISKIPMDMSTNLFTQVNLKFIGKANIMQW